MPAPTATSPRLALLLTGAALLHGCGDVPDLSPPNEPPRANDDSVTLLQDLVVDLFVTNNDVDIDGDPLTVEITRPPANGSAELSGASTIRYTPGRLFVGTDTFGYRITDLAGFQDDAEVTITVLERELRVLFETETEAGINRVYLLDSREPDTLTDMSAGLADDESVVGWIYDVLRSQALITTDANRLLAVPLADPTATEILALQVADTETLDPGLDVTDFGRVAYTVDNRHLRTIDLDDAETQSFDRGWSPSTMRLGFLAAAGTSAVLQGGFGTPRRAAIYQATIGTTAPVAVVDVADADAIPRTLLLEAQNSMLWLLEQPGATADGGFTCAAPPEQRLSHVSVTSLVNPSVSTDLNAGSGLLAEPAAVIAYAAAEQSDALVIAGCPSGADEISLIEVPYASPSTARVLTTTPLPLHVVDAANGGNTVVYAVEDAGALHPVRLQLGDSSVDRTDFSAEVPDYAGFDGAMGLVAPVSRFSADGRRWLFVGPVDGAPRNLVWVEMDTLASASLALPFDIGEPISDGYHAFVTSDNGDGTSSVALIDLGAPAITPLAVPGQVVRSEGALATPRTRLAPVPPPTP